MHQRRQARQQGRVQPGAAVPTGGQQPAQAGSGVVLYLKNSGQGQGFHTPVEMFSTCVASTG